jgi:hypothetical protein
MGTLHADLCISVPLYLYICDNILLNSFCVEQYFTDSQNTHLMLHIQTHIFPTDCGLYRIIARTTAE